MNQPNIQPVQQATQAVQPSMPIPQEPGFMQSDPNNIEFSIDEASGQLVMVPKGSNQPTQQQTTDVPTDDIRFQNGRDNAATQTVPESNPYEDRIVRMEGMMGQIGTLLQGIMSGQGLSNLSQQPQQQEPQVDLSELDGNGLVNLINKAVENAINKTVQPMQQTQSEILIRQQYNDAAYRYGQDFLTLTPAMVELKKSDPNLPWDKAFEVIKMGIGLLSKKSSTNSDSTIQSGNGSTRQPQPAQALIDRANKLTTETNGNPRIIVNDTPKISTVNQAFDKAWSDLGLG